MNNLVSVEVKQQLGSITSNLDKVEQSIKESLEAYKNFVVTEDTIAASKSAVAELRKGKAELDASRKAIKNSWNVPYLEFEKRAKQVIALYDEPIDLINAQLKCFEQKRREEKKTKIREIYDSLKGEFAEYLSFEDIYDAKWENASTTLKSITEDMQTSFDNVAMNICTIKQFESEFESEGLDVYKHTLNLQKAIEEMRSRKKMKEEIIRKEKEKAEASIKQEQEGQARTEDFMDIPPVQEELDAAFCAEDEEPFLPAHVIKVTASEEQLAFIIDFLKKNEIDYEVI